jgi:positive phototaxis protein PixI
MPSIPTVETLPAAHSGVHSDDDSAVYKLLSLYLPPHRQVLLSTQHLTEILPITPLDITPVPESSDPVMGVYNWRGEVLWLVDLGYLLAQTPLFQQGCDRSGYSVIVIQFQGHSLGLVVNNVGEMQTIPTAAITPPQTDAATTAIFQGCYQTNDGQIRWILDIDVVIDRIAQLFDRH